VTREKFLLARDKLLNYLAPRLDGLHSTMPTTGASKSAAESTKPNS
jgi:hypothetical protein